MQRSWLASFAAQQQRCTAVPLALLRCLASDSGPTASGHQEHLLRRWARILTRYEALGRSEKRIASCSDTSAAPKEQEQLPELLRVFGRGQALVPEQLSRRLVHFYTHVLQPQDRAWFFRLVCSELGLDGECRLSVQCCTANLFTWPALSSSTNDEQVMSIVTCCGAAAAAAATCRSWVDA